MIMLATYQLFNVMFSFEFHMDTIFVYLHTFRLRYFDFPFSPNTADSAESGTIVAFKWYHHSAESGTTRITLSGSKMPSANIHLIFQ